MRKLAIASGLLFATAGLHHSTAAQVDAQVLEKPAAALSISLAQYIGGGGGPYWGFELTGSGTTFRMRHPGPGNTQGDHNGTITNQISLPGGNWLIQGTVGAQPITVFIERMGPGACSDGHVVGDDRVRVVWDSKLYRGCGDLT